MPEGWRITATRGISAVAFGVGLAAVAGMATAAPDWRLVELRSDLTELSDALREDSPLRDRNVSDLVEDLGIDELNGLTAPAAAQVEPAKAAELTWTDKRHALSALSQIYGGQDNRDVMQAGRDNDTEALKIASGTATLDQLRQRLTARHLGRDIETGRDVLRVPLVIGREATLRLTEGETLLLSREDGAFIVNFGRLEIVGGEISSDEAQEPEARDFAPFVATVGTGTVGLSRATFRNLGFGFTAKFAGFSIMAHPTMLPVGRNLIENSRFDGLVTVALVGVRHTEIRGNRFFDMRRNPLLVSQSPDAMVEGNLFSGDTPTNAIRVANGSSNTRLVRNIVLEGSRAGLLVSSGSDNVEVSRNVIWRRNGGGVKLYKVNCGTVERNVILDDKQKGVEIRSSTDVLVLQNRIIGNTNAGVWVSANSQDNMTYVVDNLIRENGSGLSTASGGNIAMKGNDLSQQFPRFLDGDVTFQFRAIIEDLRGANPILLNSGGVGTALQLTPENCEL